MKHNPAFFALVEDAKARVPHIDVPQYEALDNKGILIDIREESEWNAGRAAGAIHLGKGIIERDIETKVPDKAQRLVLYCGGGYRSILAGEALTKMGYTDVVSLDGGWRAWQEAGLPMEP